MDLAEHAYSARAELDARALLERAWFDGGHLEQDAIERLLHLNFGDELRQPIDPLADANQ